jgi:hypothetical protein
LPWAGAILNDPTLTGRPADKVDRLYEAAMENIAQAGGIESQMREASDKQGQNG